LTEIIHDDAVRKSRAIRSAVSGIFWNLTLSAIKFAAGILGHSNALIADAIHSFSDLLTDMAVIAGVHYAARPVDQGHHYGHGKFETLSSVFIAFILLLASLAILWEGLYLLFKASQGSWPRVPDALAFWIAVLSVIIKEGMYQYTIRIANKINSQAVKVNAWHHRSDAFSSLAVSIGIGGAILLGNKWSILDAITAALVGLWVLQFAIRSFINGMNELLEASLDDEKNQQILTLVRTVPGVINPHNLRTRRIGNSIAVDMHIKVARSLSIVEAHDIATEVEQRLKDFLGRNSFISVHVEPASEEAG